MRIVEWLKGLFKKEPSQKKLCPMDHKRIALRHLKGESQLGLAKEYGISRGAVSRIVSKSRLASKQKGLKNECRTKKRSY